MEDKILKIENELKETLQAMENTKQQIQALNQKGEQLAMHATYLNGKLDALKELQEGD